jgi:hypothetical protein
VHESHPMRTLVSKTGLVLTATVGIIASTALAGQARPVNPNSLIAQDIFPGSGSTQTVEPSTESSSSVLQPTGKVADYYGLVRSFDGQNLDLVMMDGTSKTFELPPNIGGSVPDIQPGSLVALDVVKKNSTVIQGLQPAIEDRLFTGKVTNVSADQVTLVSEGGETLTTTVSESTIARMGITPDMVLDVQQYSNVPTTKVCIRKEIAEVPAPPIQPPAPIFTPQPAAPPIIDGFW